MHAIQRQLLELAKHVNLARLSLREMAVRIGLPNDSPQKVKHHLQQLQKLIKLQFGGRALQEQAVKAVTQCMLEGARSQGLDLSASSVIYTDLPRNVVYTARAGKRILNDIKAACETISQIWDSIPPPAPSRRRKAA